MAIGYKKLGGKAFVLYKRYFFCTFFNRGLLQLNVMYTHFWSLKLSNFEMNWEPLYAQHYYMVFQDSQVANKNFCRLKNVMYLYRRKRKCKSKVVLVHMIISASGINITMYVCTLRGSLSAVVL